MGYTSDINHTSDAHSGFDRARVDVAQTSFFEGREFRTFKELNIATSATYVIKAAVPVNLILFGLEADIDSGFLRIGTYVTGTEGGSFSETLPILGTNNMSAGKDHRATYNGNFTVYVAKVVLTAGGTHTGGIELDVLRLKTASITAQASSVGRASSDERGVAANTYYFRLSNLSSQDAVTGVFRARWEERT